MLERWSEVRPDERRTTLAAFGALFAFLFGHALLETARDALFLTRLPPERLPFVYLAVAVVALGLAALGAGRRAPGGRGLAAWAFAAAGAAAGFRFAGGETEGGLYALYVWSAVSVTVFVTRFWSLLAARFTVTQAKRLYSLIGAASVGGALAGTAVAGVLAWVRPALDLLVVASGAFLVAGGAAYAVGPSPTGPREPEEVDSRTALATALATPYARRVGLVVLLSAFAATLADYVFKASVVTRIPAERLGAVLGAAYFGVNLLALGLQLGAVRGVLRLAGVPRSLAALPVSTGVAAIAFALGGGLPAAAALRAVDGGLRHSLHRTAVELLYLPMRDAVRSAAKPVFEALGQRGGQAVASLWLLAATAAGLGPRAAAASVALACAATALVGWRLGPLYLQRFRDTLREGSVTHVAPPGLDLSSLEAILVALNSSTDSVVRAAISLLDAQGRARLVPALILYHPSPEVVLDALGVLVRSGRRDFLPVLDRLLEHPDPSVRVAVVRARTALGRDRVLIERLLRDASPAVRVTALARAAAFGWLPPAEAGDRLARAAREGDEPTRVALARAIASRPAAVLEDVLLELGRDPAREVCLEAIRAMAVLPSARFLPVLVAALERRATRAEARAALVAIGAGAFSYLVAALGDVQRPRTLRQHLPRTLMRFAPGPALAALMEQLVVERDGAVAFKLLRAVGRLRADHPELTIDPVALRRLALQVLDGAFRHLERRLSIERETRDHPERLTEVGRLVLQLLREKQRQAEERAFRVLGIARPSEDFESLHRGASSRDPKIRASSLELLESLLDSALGERVLALVGELTDEERVGRGVDLGVLQRLPPPDFAALLAELAAGESETIAVLAGYWAQETGVSEDGPPSLRVGRSSPFAAALAGLGGVPGAPQTEAG